MAQTRRQFIKRGVTFVGAGLVAPRLLVGRGSGAAWAAAPGSGRVLVIVELAGGNDGLNTVVPYTAAEYYRARPRLAIPPASALPVDGAVGLHPSLAALKALYDEQRVAVVQGVGYPGPDRSHFRSTEIWQTAVPGAFESTGWLGRYLDATADPGSGALEAVSLGYESPAALATASAAGVAAIESYDTYQFRGDSARPEDDANKRAAFDGLYDDARGSGGALDVVAGAGLLASASADSVQRAAAGYAPAVAYPADPFGQGLLKIAQLVDAGLGTDLFYTSLGSFDTHANQLGEHATLLGQLSEGLAAFYRDMASRGRSGDVLVMTFSEFGRRVGENESGGTDHGTAGPMFVVGDAVRGGVYGDHPSLTALDAIGDLEYGIDFRSVYATVLRRWLGADPEPILGGQFEEVGFL